MGFRLSPLSEEEDRRPRIDIALQGRPNGIG